MVLIKPLAAHDPAFYGRSWVPWLRLTVTLAVIGVPAFATWAGPRSRRTWTGQGRALGHLGRA
jgi:hypothetical protein